MSSRRYLMEQYALIPEHIVSEMSACQEQNTKLKNQLSQQEKRYQEKFEQLEKRMQNYEKNSPSTSQLSQNLQGGGLCCCCCQRQKSNIQEGLQDSAEDLDGAGKRPRKKLRHELPQSPNVWAPPAQENVYHTNSGNRTELKRDILEGIPEGLRSEAERFLNQLSKTSEVTVLDDGQFVSPNNVPLKFTIQDLAPFLFVPIDDMPLKYRQLVSQITKTSVSNQEKKQEQTLKQNDSLRNNELLEGRGVQAEDNDLPWYYLPQYL